MNNNNDIKDVLFAELYIKGYDFRFCETLVNVICEINPPSGNQNEQWVQDIMESRLRDIKKAIESTLSLTSKSEKV